MFELIKSKIFKNVYYAFKNGTKVFSYRDYGDKYLIFPYAKYFNKTTPFSINKDELSDIIEKIIL